MSLGLWCCEKTYLVIQKQKFSKRTVNTFMKTQMFKTTINYHKITNNRVKNNNKETYLLKP